MIASVSEVGGYFLDSEHKQAENSLVMVFNDVVLP